MGELRTSRCTSWVSKRQRNQRSSCQHLLDHWESKGIPEKTSIYASLTTLKPLCGSQQTAENSLRDHLTCLLRNLDVGQEETVRTGCWTVGSKLGKEYDKAVYCHPVYLTYMHSTSSKTPGWMKHKLESSLSGDILTTSDMQTGYNGTIMAESEEELSSHLMRVKEESKKLT